MGRKPSKTLRTALPTDTVQIAAQVTVYGKSLIKEYAKHKRLSVDQFIVFLIEREMQLVEPLSPRFN